MTTEKYSTLSPSQASAMFAGRLVTDFSMVRVKSGWAILLQQVGGSASVLRSDALEADEAGKIFDTADEALYAAYQIGFDVGTIGIWRPGAERTKRLLDDAMDTLQRSVSKR